MSRRSNGVVRILAVGSGSFLVSQITTPMKAIQTSGLKAMARNLASSISSVFELPLHRLLPSRPYKRSSFVSGGGCLNPERFASSLNQVPGCIGSFLWSLFQSRMPRTSLGNAQGAHSLKQGESRKTSMLAYRLRGMESVSVVVSCVKATTAFGNTVRGKYAG